MIDYIKGFSAISYNSTYNENDNVVSVGKTSIVFKFLISSKM